MSSDQRRRPVSESATGAPESAEGRRSIAARASSYVVDRALALAVTGLTLVLRLAYAAVRPTDWDSAQFVAGLHSFDVTHGSPHPPGYFLYEMAGRLVRLISGLDATTSLVVVAATASALAAGVMYMAAREFAGRWVSLGAVALVASSPVAWFAGSIVSTYSFDALAAALLLLFARRARPGNAYGAIAIGTLAVLAGFRQSLLETLAPLALLAIAASVRSVRDLMVAIACGCTGLAVWMIPMSLMQSGGLVTWYRAAHVETVGAYHTSSLLYHNHGGGRTNLGILAAYTMMMTGAAIVVGVIVGATRIRRRRREPRPGAAPAGAHVWYQGGLPLMVVAVSPAIIVYLLIEFGKGGYALAFVLSATILLLAPLSQLSRERGATSRMVRGLAAVLIVGTVAFNAQRFTAGRGILPATVGRRLPRLWLTQTRYGAPYPETAATIRAADRAEAELQGLQAKLRPSDVLVTATTQPGAVSFRNVGSALPNSRQVYVTPGAILYQQLHGELYYVAGRVLRVGLGQRALWLIVAVPDELRALAAASQAHPLGLQAGGFQLWEVSPGATFMGITIAASANPPPLSGDILRPAIAS